MEPSAKININRKDNGDWILCPSKSIPGKFYYFNVRTGEAVWYQSETENKVPRNDKETNKNNEYLKPVSPRKDNPTTSNVCFPSNVSFPKYVSNVPNITWTIQLPMCVANMSEVTKRTLDQNTQTPEPDRELFVQTSATSLSQRFTLFENTNTSMTLNTNIINKDDNCVNGLRFRSSTPMKNWWNREIINSTNKTEETSDSMFKRKHDDLKFVLKEPQLKRIRIFPDRHCKDQLSFSNNLNSPFYSTENTNLNGQYKVENAITNPVADNQGLDQSDLRILLQMKRQRSIDTCMKYNENKKRENSLLKEMPKKRVTFHLDNNDEDYSLDIVDANKEILKAPTPIKSLKGFNKDVNEIWYICVDEDILINDFNFIKDYINEDDLCKLLIPDTMVKYMESLGRGEHGGRDRVMFARQVYRHLVTSRQVQIVETEDGSSLMDDIVKCCLQVMDEDIQIVLITKNLELENVAKMFGIDVYSLDDIKNDLTNPNSRRSNENNTKYNIFLQNINDFDPFVLSKSINPEKRLKDSQFIYNKDVDMNLTNQTNGHVNKDDLYNCKYAFDTIHNKNSENNPTDVCKRIEKLKLIDEKSTNIRKVINNSIYINNEIENSRNDNPNTNRQTDRYYTTLDKEEDDKNKYRIKSNQRKHYLSKLTLNFKDLHQKSMSIDNGKDLKIYNGPVVSIDNFGDEQNLIYDEDIKNNIIVRYDEWICCYVQIMEEFVHSILQIHFNYENEMPYFLNEGLDLLKGIFSNSRTIRTIIEKLLAFNGLFTIKDINKTHADPNDFMKMVECGFFLVEGFKNILSEDFSDIEDSLVKLLESIENSNYVEESETVETSLRRSDEDTCVLRCNFVKKRSDIIDYLKKHFVEWKNYVEVDQDTQDELNPRIKIFRTSGRDLNTFKIDNHKRISYENPTDKIKSHKDGIDKFNRQNDIETPLHIPIPHRNTFGDDNENNGPKMIRNIKLIDEFEENVNKAKHLDLDYSEINTLSSASGTYKDFNKNNDSGTIDNLNDFDITDINESLSMINDARNDSTVDSGFGNEVHACSLIKSFLIELGSTFKLIYSFVDKCIKEFQCDELSDETKNELVNRANRTHTHIADVIEKLKSIIERESADSTLKTLIIKAGNDVIEDKRMTRYRQTVFKCLEQAQVLESSLKIMMNVTNEDCDVSLSSKNDITHFNIFE